jgi:hypothetical protein
MADEEFKQAKANAKAEKARAKSLRPWFKKKRIIIPLILLVIIILAAASSGSDTDTDTSANSDSTTETSQETNTTAGIGDAVRDGKFEFVVKSVDCGETVLGNNEFLQEEAQGEFCILDVTVKNIGDEPQTFFGSDQLVFNEAGQKYNNDSSAEFALDADGDTWLEEINPGNSLAGKIVFDVPVDTKLVKAELHDSAFSDGVEVSLQ